MQPKRIFMLGATGTIGRATVLALLQRGHDVVCFVRPTAAALPGGAQRRMGDVMDAGSITRDGFACETFDAVVSCMASRTGTPGDAWAIDHRAHLNALAAAKAAGVSQMVLLSAICVQKPLLEFQRAKLAFEDALIHSGLTYSIVRPTAFFKSLSGQIARVKAGKPFLLFGDGTLTACKPISNHDLAAYLADCLDATALHNRILPIGGPGPAMTPRAQGEALFRLAGQPPKFRTVPMGVMHAIIAVLAAAGRLSPRLRDKAELARIGRYYATQSMLVWNPATGFYDADATPTTGQDLLEDHYRILLNSDAQDERGDHAVF